jgi:hypothetical protein
MRYESSVTSLSWIPSEAVEGSIRRAFDAGIMHYDEPPADRLADIAAMQAADQFRFANVLRAWIDLDRAGRITDFGYSGGGLKGATTIRLGGWEHCFQAVALPDMRTNPECGDGWVRFTQAAGGRTGFPAPRPVRGRPYGQWRAPMAWTTLSLTLHARASAEFALTAASSFPRHWVYDDDGQLVRKSGLTDFRGWYYGKAGGPTPWGSEDSPVLVTAVETSLERALSAQLMHGATRPRIVRIPAGALLARQGEPGTEVFLLLDGVIGVERNGNRLADYGPGALLGERAQLEAGIRTSSLIAITACRLAAVSPGELDRSALRELSSGHRREDIINDHAQHGSELDSVAGQNQQGATP